MSKIAKNANNNLDENNNVEPLKRDYNTSSKSLEKITRITMITDDYFLEVLNYLRELIKAKTFEEVVRRSLVLYDTLSVEELNRYYLEQKENPFVNKTKEDLKHLNLNSPEWVKNMLDKEKQKTGKSYADIIRHSLYIMSQKYEESRQPKNNVISTFELH